MSLHLGLKNGSTSVSKPIYLLAILAAIDENELNCNQIEFENTYIRRYFGSKYEEINGNKKGFGSSFFIRPYFHLGSSDFYHLIWKSKSIPALSSNTPSTKYLRENLLYAKLDDELWNLLQVSENREIIRKNIINRYFSL